MWDGQATPARLLTFRSGGWVLLLTVLIAVVIIAVTVAPALRRLGDRPPGDGRNPAAYGFDLSTCLVPRDELVAAQLHRDLLQSLVDSPFVDGRSVARFNEDHRGKYLVSRDRVIGVQVGDKARAYPLLVLSSHEIVNDALGGRPIAVTYNPLCDSVVVFDRTVDGQVLSFGVSGLLYNSNLLMYDRRPDMRSESLWSQLEARAITGPAAESGRRLTVIPAELTHWEDWLSRHPDTTVLAPDEAALQRYRPQHSSYQGYFLTDGLMFAVEAAPSEHAFPPKTPCVVVRAAGGDRLYPLASIADRVDGTGVWTDAIDGEIFTFHHAPAPNVVRVTSGAGEEAAVVIYCFWFAWHAIHPDTEVGGM